MDIRTSSNRRSIRKSILGSAARTRTRASLLVCTLGITAAVVASPPPPRTGNISLKVATHRSWYQIGKASWYGSEFQGHKTANGERFNMNDLTCAHRSLPLGSWVRVTNLRNNKSAFLRVNDRGPVPRSIIMDLSRAAARKLGVTGLAQVRIDKVEPNDPRMAEEIAASLPPATMTGIPEAAFASR
jgi:rare lipoprotein A